MKNTATFPFGIASPRLAQACTVALLLFCLLYGADYLARAWSVDAAGLNRFGRSFAWDFLNSWEGGRLALAGDLATLFDPEAYRAYLRATYGSGIASQEWSYPPTLLVFAAPLSLLPLGLAYGLMTIGGMAMLRQVLRAQGITGLLAWLTPGVFINLIFGQYGTWCAVLLWGGLLLVGSRPILAGILIGLLTVKPHLGLLVPVCLLAGQHWRAMCSAAITAAGLVLLSVFCFGSESWALFFAHTVPTMTAILDAPYPQGYHVNSITWLTLLQSLGAPLSLAYLVQYAVMAGSAGLLWRLWRRGEVAERAGFAVLLTLLATPYGYAYDMAMLAPALLVLSALRPRPLLTLFAMLGWAWPLLVNPLGWMGMPITPLLLSILFVLALPPRARGAATDAPPIRHP